MVDLNLLTKKVPFTEFNSKRFAAAVVRLRNPKTTCLFFGSGKAVCTGACSVAASFDGASVHTQLLQMSGMDVKMLDFQIQNIVNVTDCGFALDLQKFCKKIEGIVSYEPDLFPGLTYRVKTQSHYWIVFLIFQSGKCVITGAKKQEDAEQVWDQFYRNVVLPYKATYDFGSSGNYRICQRLCMNLQCDAVQSVLMAPNRGNIGKVTAIVDDMVQKIKRRKLGKHTILQHVFAPHNHTQC